MPASRLVEGSMSLGPSRARQSRRLVTAAVTAVLLLLATAGASSAGGSGAHATADPVSHFDPAEGTTALDVYGARFGQIASTDLTLVLRTYAPWDPAQVVPTDFSGLCVWLRNDESATPGGRICVIPSNHAKSGVALRYTTLDHAGNRIGIRDLATVVGRPRRTTISTHFSPALLRLVPDRYHWYVRSLSHGVEDRLPDTGQLPLDIALSTAPAARARCFGAASRDPRRRCVNSKLRREVVPTPEEAVVSQNSPCTPVEIDGLVSPCEFGVPAADARATIALIGDSHASHWRAALEGVAQHKRWRGISITRSGCPLSRASPTLDPASRRQQCLRWNRQVPKWLVRHPQVHTIFVVAHFAAAVVTRHGRDELAAKIDGYVKAWKALPASITRVVVIRDTPLVGFDAFDCVQRARATHRNAGKACSVPRNVALRTDAAVVAARRVGSRQVRVIDMTHFFCSRRRCYPVVGGALVYKDDQHMTEVFGTTLEPYLRRAIDRL
jgi:hypothetical protein